MLKVALLSVMVACAMSMNMPNLGNLGGLMQQAQGLLGGMDSDGIEELMKNFNPKMMEDIMSQMPPQMQEMMDGMGISKKDLTKAMEDLPEHMDEIKGFLGGAKGENKGDIMSTLKGMMPPEIRQQIDDVMENPEKAEEKMQEFKDQAYEALKDFGLSLEDFEDMHSIMPKLMVVLRKQLKDEGIEIDLDKPETINEAIRKYLYETFGFSDDEDPEKVKKVLTDYLNEQMGPALGFEFDPDNMPATFEKAKGMFIKYANDFGFDLKEGSTNAEIKEAVMTKLKDMGIDFSNPSSLMSFAMQHMDTIKNIFGSFMGGMMGGEQPQQQPMPMPMPMPVQQVMPQMPQMPQLPINLNLEINVDGSHNAMPPTTVPSYMNAGAQVPAGAVEELIQDLMHYRSQARMLMVKNQMLERELMAQRMVNPAPTPMTNSPFLNRIIAKCRHHQ